MELPEDSGKAIAVGRTHKVVLVDDDPGILRALERLLRGEPYWLLPTQSPEQALKWTQDASVSLVITDQRMPGMSGADLLQKISERSPRTARVLLTGYQSRTVALPGARSGIELVVYKPWNDDSLKRMIRWILHRLEVEKDLEGVGPREKQETEP